MGVLAPFKWLFFNLRGLTKPTPRGPVGLAGMKVWVMAALEKLAMLAMRAHGFDTCPMEGFDAVREKLLLPRGADVTMVVSAGKRAEGQSTVTDSGSTKVLS